MSSPTESELSQVPTIVDNENMSKNESPTRMSNITAALAQGLKPALENTSSAIKRASDATINVTRQATEQTVKATGDAVQFVTSSPEKLARVIKQRDGGSGARKLLELENYSGEGEETLLAQIDAYQEDSSTVAVRARNPIETLLGLFCISCGPVEAKK